MPFKKRGRLTETVALAEIAATVEALTSRASWASRSRWTTWAHVFSCLERLMQLPIDIIQVPRTFIEGIAEGAREAAIGQAVVEAAQRLGLTVAAEGVEAADQLACLRELGCDLVQGFLLAGPQESPYVEGLLADEPCRGIPPCARPEGAASGRVARARATAARRRRLAVSCRPRYPAGSASSGGRALGPSGYASRGRL